MRSSVSSATPSPSSGHGAAIAAGRLLADPASPGGLRGGRGIARSVDLWIYYQDSPWELQPMKMPAHA